jgi:putative peptidoglycan lipid II flippase
MINIVVNTVYAVFSFILFPLFHVQGLALAHSLCYLSGSTLAGFVLARRIGGLDKGRTAAALARAALASLVAAGAMVLGVVAVSSVLAPGGERALAQLLVGAAAGGVAFLIAAKLLRIEELDALRNLLPFGRSRASAGLV